MVAVQSRAYQREQDYSRISELLTTSYQNNQRLYNWSNSHWDRSDYVRKVRLSSGPDRIWEEGVWVWQTEEGRLVGVVHLEPMEGICLQLDPDYRFIEEEMFAWAEEHILRFSSADLPRNILSTRVFDYDRKRATLLANRGFTNDGPVGSTLRRTLTGPVPEVRLPADFSIRTVQEASDFENRSLLQQRLCGNDWTIEIMQLLRQAPAYRKELDLAVAAPAGQTIGFCSAWLDDHNWIGEIEPVVVDPDFRRAGLASAVVSEILFRLKELGASMAYVVTAGTDPRENRFWEKMGFDGIDLSYLWVK